MTTLAIAADDPAAGSATPAHPVVRLVDDTRRRAAALADVPLDDLDPLAVTDLVRALTALESQVAALKARAVAQAEAIGLPRDSGTRSAAVWLARTTQVTPVEARRTTRLAAALVGREHLRRATSLGDVHPEQAVAIAGAVARIGGTSSELAEVEHTLVGQAASSDAPALVELGRSAARAADPEGYAAQESAAREDREARQRRRRATALTLNDDGGETHGQFTIPAEHGSALRRLLAALVEPHDPPSSDPRPPGPSRLGAAFLTLIDQQTRGRSSQADDTGPTGATGPSGPTESDRRGTKPVRELLARRFRELVQSDQRAAA